MLQGGRDEDPVRSRLLVLVARPGSGRTTWFQRRHQAAPARWEAWDRGGARLVVAGPAPALGGLPALPAVEAAWAAIEARGPGSLFERLRDEPEAFVGFDDLHLLDDVKLDRVADELSAYADAGVQTATTARRYVDWPVARLVIDGRVGVLGDADLALDAAALAGAAGEDVADPPGWVRELAQRSGGWATAAKAAAELGRRQAAPTPEEVDAIVDALAEVLTTAVVDACSAEEVEVLLVAAAVDGLSPRLADALLGPGAGARLVALARTEPILEPDPTDRDALVLPTLLATGLRRRLEVVSDPRPQELARAAAAWHQEADHPRRAIQLLVDRGLWAGAVELLVASSLRAAEQGDDHDLWSLFEVVPRPIWDGDPEPALHYAALALGAGQHEAATDVLASATLDRPRLTPAQQVRHDTTFASSVLHGTRADVALARAERALATVADAGPGEPPGHARPLAAVAAARAEVLLYRWDHAVARLDAIADDPAVAFLPRLHGQATAAWAHALRGEARAALRHAADATAAAAHRGLPDHHVLGEAHLARAQVGLLQGDEALLQDALARADEVAVRQRSVVRRTAALTIRAQAALRAGDPDLALQLLDEVRAPHRDAWHQRAGALRARALGRLGERGRALAALADLAIGPDTVVALAELDPTRAEEVEAWRAPSWPITRLHRLVARATIAAHVGSDSLADELVAALAVAAPEALAGPFLELPAAARVALNALPGPWHPLLEHPAGPGQPDPARLTAREAEVLGAIAGPASLAAIAGDLYLSPNTLKTHLRNLYRKLGVRSRAEAVVVAQRLGVL
ncbi:LuxR C-terminal-related transcriptional regulator [Aquihabitans sp. G128]|uniref:LuxR C-terminal-related transcriptional regulator n=1 Tax=Aquihabitans sp. G128 TaxID=2849779 RepID=UPI001C23A7F1|nr:LuxR C-terminal-related transcriptional regulator [Aquihabitans sp. G128]QXC59954.1 LuxR C-terminal-related transcriptional regulator [Aquihabitans sp. G128]